MTDSGRIPTIRVDPIDPARMSRNDQLATLAGMVQLYRDQSDPLSVLEFGALGAALDQVMDSGITPTIQTIADALLAPTSEAAADAGVTEDRLREIGRSLAPTLTAFVGVSQLPEAAELALHDKTIWALSDDAFDARFPFLMGRHIVRRLSMRTRITILVIAMIILVVVMGMVL